MLRRSMKKISKKDKCDAYSMLESDCELDIVLQFGCYAPISQTRHTPLQVIRNM